MARNTIMARHVIRDFGTCLIFNGTSSKVTTDCWSTAVNNISMGAWFKSKNYRQNRQPIISNGDGSGSGAGYALTLSGDATTDGSLYLLNHNTAWISLGAKVQDDQWHHIFLTIDGSNNTKAYLDGVEIFSAGSQSLGNPRTNSYVGADNTASGFFYGSIDDARLYTRGLTGTEVTNLFYGIEPSSTSFANWYRFNEGSGTSATDSQGSMTGTITSGTYSTNVFMTSRATVTNRTSIYDYGTSLYFNGTNAHVQAADSASLDISGSFTLAAWVFRNTTLNGENGIISKTKYNMILTSTGRVRHEFERASGGVAAFTGSVVVQPLTWTHVAITYNQTQRRIYINGVEDTGSPQAETAAVAVGTDVYRIGLHSAGRFPGYIDDPRTYARALSAAEIADLFYGRSVSSTDLVCWYKFDEGSGTSATDSSGNSNTGTISNATYSTFVKSIPRVAA